MRLLIPTMLLLASPALAESASPAPVAAPATAATPVREKVICRTMPVTGSRLGGKRECMTAARWDERAKDDRETAEKMARLGRIRDNAGGQ